MFRADLLRWFAHGAKLVSQWVSPEVGEKQSTEKEGKGTVSSTPGSLHLGTADGLDIELQDHHAEDDHPKRQDDRWPWLYFTLGNRCKEQIFANIVVAFVGFQQYIESKMWVIAQPWLLRDDCALTSVVAERTMTQGRRTAEETRLSRA